MSMMRCSWKCNLEWRMKLETLRFSLFNSQGKVSDYAVPLQENTKQGRTGKKRTKPTRYYDNLKYAVLQGYGSVCVHCGTDDERLLTLDHVNNDGNLRRRCKDRRAEYRRALEEKFPPDLQILCFNCNNLKDLLRRRHYIGREHG